jgi:hypothetical protein
MGRFVIFTKSAFDSLDKIFGECRAADGAWMHLYRVPCYGVGLPPVYVTYQGEYACQKQLKHSSSTRAWWERWPVQRAVVGAVVFKYSAAEWAACAHIVCVQFPSSLHTLHRGN